MLSSISIGRYYSAKSNIHSMHPLSKIICVLLFILMVLCFNSYVSILILSLLVIVMMLNTGVPFKLYYHVVKNLKFLLLLIFIFFTLISFSFVSGILILVKAILIVIYLAILTLTTPTTEIIYGLEQFLYPLKRFNIKSNVLALNIGLFLRFIPTFIDERNRIRRSQIVRGVDYSFGFSKYFISTVGMLRPAFVLAKAKTHKLKNSMLVRLYSIDKIRVNFRINKWKLFDDFLIFTHVFVFIVILLKGVLL